MGLADSGDITLDAIGNNGTHRITSSFADEIEARFDIVVGTIDQRAIAQHMRHDGAANTGSIEAANIEIRNNGLGTMDQFGPLGHQRIRTQWIEFDVSQLFEFAASRAAKTLSCARLC